MLNNKLKKARIYNNIIKYKQSNQSLMAKICKQIKKNLQKRRRKVTM